MNESQSLPYVYVRSINQAGQVTAFYLHIDPQNDLPILLGTGRNAVIFLATTSEVRDSEANHYRAIKFLRDDIDQQYARASAERFFEEADKAKRFDHLQSTFVKYFGWGAIGKPQPLDQKEVSNDFWWKHHLNGLERRLIDYDDESNNRELERIRQHYKLQGPFYVLDLCQGTLYDLLDRPIPWSELPAYTISKFHDSLNLHIYQASKDIEQFTATYLTYSPSNRSGYDILNSFKDNEISNRIRSHAVLEIFRQVVYTVSELHKKERQFGSRNSVLNPNDPLAHRDLKPGNIFLQHDANTSGLNMIRFQLGDLGYVTNAGRIIEGDATLRSGRKGIDYQAPGSQYYRAPEQAELPVEVRVDARVEPNNLHVVHVRGSKINHIDINDWLLLNDIFNDSTEFEGQDPRLFQIRRTEQVSNTHNVLYRLELDKEINTTKPKDLQGQIIRATGFHTDGFSLGAILYDMISGGKDPQLFYTYCVVSLTSQFAQQSYSINDIVEILYPNQKLHLGLDENEKLNLSERRQMIKEVLEANGLDQIIDRMITIALHNSPFHPPKKFGTIDKVKLMNEVWQAGDIDDVISLLIKSPYFVELTSDLSLTKEHSKLQQNIKDILKHYRFRNFHLVSDLLRDKRDVPIPREILSIIVACMVRDMEGSFYMCDPVNGYTSDHNFEAATKIHERINQLLGQLDYRLPEGEFPHPLEENLLFKLRSLSMSTQSNQLHEHEFGS